MSSQKSKDLSVFEQKELDKLLKEAQKKLNESKKKNT